MLSPHLRKFSDFYEKYGLGAVKNLWLLTCLIPIARTVNLYNLKDHVGGLLEKRGIDPMSHYRRLTRFFEDWGGREDFLHDLLHQNLCFLKKMGFRTLVMDGTSWKIGDTEVHYLVLSVLAADVAVPIYWVQLEKLGASSQSERKEMFEKALSLFDLRGMTLLADREYVGTDWFKYLKTKKIHFVIRMRLGDYESNVDAVQGKSYLAMYAKCAAKDKIVKKQVFIGGEGYITVMMPNPNHDAQEPVFIFLTTLPDAKTAAKLYAKRWKIECLFKHLKSNGYNLEDLNLRNAGKNLLMFAIVTRAYILAIREGLKRQKTIPINKYADGSEWPETSIFREGLSFLTPICYRFVGFLKYVFNALSPKNHAIFKNVQ
jgi:Transposase DDE domain